MTIVGCFILGLKFRPPSQPAGDRVCPHPARTPCLPSPRAAPHRGSPLTAAFTSPPRSNLIFRFLQNKTRIQIWLFENTELRIEGKIIGFDEYMNLVLDDAEELSLKQKTRKPLGAPRRPRTLRT